MPRKQKQPMARRPVPIRWEFAADIPTHDFFEERPLTDLWNLQEAVESFVHWLEEDRFLTWEAVVSEEQGLSLTTSQKEALGGLLDFGDADDDPVLSIDEIPRPSEPWHAILSQLVPHLLVEPFRTFDVQTDVQSEGWPRIMAALKEHGPGRVCFLPTSSSFSQPPDPDGPPDP
jgi:hypothetical protein